MKTDTVEVNEFWAKRRHGRTTWLLQEAAGAAYDGQCVLYVAPNLEMAQYAQKLFLGEDMLPDDGGGSVTIESVSTVNNQRGRLFDLVLLDDADAYEDRIAEVLPFAMHRAIIMREKQ